MAVPFSNTTLRVPSGFQALLHGMAKEVLLAQPTDIYSFAALYFENLLRVREGGAADPVAKISQIEDRTYNNKVFRTPSDAEPAEVVDKEDEQWDEESAAAKIQAGVRGYVTRQRLENDQADEMLLLDQDLDPDQPEVADENDLQGIATEENEELDNVEHLEEIEQAYDTVEETNLSHGTPIQPEPTDSELVGETLAVEEQNASLDVEEQPLDNEQVPDDGTGGADEQLEEEELAQQNSARDEEPDSLDGREPSLPVEEGDNVNEDNAEPNMETSSVTQDEDKEAESETLLEQSAITPEPEESPLDASAEPPIDNEEDQDQSNFVEPDADKQEEAVEEEVAEMNEAVLDSALIESDAEAGEEQVEESQVEESQAEEPLFEEAQAEEPHVEESQAEEPQVEEPQLEEPQDEEPQIDEPQSQVEEPQGEESQLDDSQADEPQAEEPQTEEPGLEADLETLEGEGAGDEE